MSQDRDELYWLFGELLHEVPEAEEAVSQQYRRYRDRQARDAVVRTMKQREREQLEAAWDELHRRLKGSGVSSDSRH